MKKFFIGILLGGLVTAVVFAGKHERSASVSAKNSPKEFSTYKTESNTIESMANSTVLIKVFDKYSALSSTGTGVVKKKDGRVYIWTVAHLFIDNIMVPDPNYKQNLFEIWNKLPIPNINQTVVEKKVTVTRLSWKDGVESSCEKKAEIIALDGDSDLAVLEVLDASHFPAESVEFYQGEEDLPIGTPVSHVGNMLGRYPFTYDEGVISHPHRESGKDANWMQISNLIRHGSSGGPVFLKSDGTLIGLVDAGGLEDNVMVSGLSFVIPSHQIKAWAIRNNLAWLFTNDIPRPSNFSPFIKGVSGL